MVLLHLFCKKGSLQYTIGVHTLEESLFLAPLFAVATIGCAAVGLDTLNGKNSCFLAFMGEHSLNIWLIHMFFYAYIFIDLVYRLIYPPVIYIVMLSICIGLSYIIKGINIGIKTLSEAAFHEKSM